MRRRGMVLEPAVRGAARVAMFGGLIGTQVQLQGGMDWAKTEVNGGRVLDNGPGPEDVGEPCNQLPCGIAWKEGWRAVSVVTCSNYTPRPEFVLLRFHLQLSRLQLLDSGLCILSPLLLGCGWVWVSYEEPEDVEKSFREDDWAATRWTLTVLLKGMFSPIVVHDCGATTSRHRRHGREAIEQRYKFGENVSFFPRFCGVLG